MNLIYSHYENLESKHSKGKKFDILLEENTEL